MKQNKTLVVLVIDIKSLAQQSSTVLTPPRWSIMETHIFQQSAGIREHRGGCSVYTVGGSVIGRGNSKQVTKTPAFTRFFPSCFFNFSTSWFQFLLLLDRRLYPCCAGGSHCHILFWIKLTCLWATSPYNLKSDSGQQTLSFLAKLTSVCSVKQAWRTFSLVWKGAFQVKAVSLSLGLNEETLHSLGLLVDQRWDYIEQPGLVSESLDASRLLLPSEGGEPQGTAFSRWPR